MRQRYTYGGMLDYIANMKNCGTLYRMGENGEFIESPLSGRLHSFQMNLFSYDIGTRYDIRGMRLPRRKKKRLFAMLKRRVRNLRKELKRMEFSNES